MYSPVLQSSSPDASGLQCIIALVVLAVVGIVLANLASKTKNAAPYSRKVATSLPREQIIKQVERALPKSLVGREFNWKPAWLTADKFTLSGYYLTNGQGCLVMFLTGLIPGYLFIKHLMGRSEEIVVDFSKFEEAGELTLEALGLRARREVDKLANKLAVQA